jgi:predicted enzyme related to lactoylglutathione lyase
MATTVPMCAVVHFEMPSKDRERAARFYASAFGWTHQMLGPEMGEPMPTPGVGGYAVFRDTEGNHHSMMQPDMAPPACKT